MKIRDPRLIRVLSWLAAGAMRPWLATLRTDVDAGPSGPHPADPSQRRFIYILWHEALLAPLLYRHIPGHVLISQHADGELIAQVCGHLGVGVVRGSSRQGGAKALLQMYRLAEKTHLFITPDGPRGPRRVLQPGVVQLASHIGLPILPVGVGFCRAWRARSWDRFAVPLPFSKIVFRGGDPLVIPPRLSAEDLEHQRLRVEQALLRITAIAEADTDSLRLGRTGQPRQDLSDAPPNLPHDTLPVPAPHSSSNPMAHPRRAASPSFHVNPAAGVHLP